MRLIINRRMLSILPSKDNMLLANMMFDILRKKYTTYRMVKKGRYTSLVPDKEFFIKDSMSNGLIIHSRVLPEVEKLLTENAIRYTLEHKASTYRNKPIRLKLKKGMDFRDDLQREYNEYLLESKDTYLCTMQTGKGKTGSTIISLLKRPEVNRIMVLIPPIFHTIWEQAFEKFTDIKKDGMLIVSGRESLYALKNISDDVSVVVMSPDTLRVYLKDYYAGNEVEFSPEELMSYVGAEYLIIDEAHKDFTNLYINALALNPKKVIMLTASFESSKDDRKVKKFKDVMIPFLDRMPEQELDKYTNIVFCQFRFENVDKLKYSNPVMKWYSHAILESDILKNPIRRKHYFDMILHFFSKYYDNKHRAIFLFITNDMVISFYNYLKNESIYKDKKIAMYIQGHKEKENLTADIIVSTDKSSGTGVDIENIQVTMNTISTESEYFGVQAPGRGRKMEGVDQYYLTLWATNINAHHRYKKSNMKLFTERAKEIINDYYAEMSV